MWDVFISHATEDKDAVARPLAERLSAAGFRVWYDESALSLGDNLRRTIDRGLIHSRYGVVVLSPSFFAKSWPQLELDGLMQRETATGKVVLPVLHELTPADVAKYSPTLADKVAVSTDRGLDVVAQQIIAVLSGTAPPPTPRGRRWRVAAVAALGVLGLLVAGIWLIPRGPTPGEAHDDLVEAAVHGSGDDVEGALQYVENDEEREAALRYAAGEGNLAAVRALLDAKVNPNGVSDLGWTPLLAAVSRGQADVVDVLLQHGADAYATVHPPAGIFTPMAMAARDGQIRIVRALLDHGVRPQRVTTDEDEKNPLTLAIDEGHTEIAELLLNGGALKGVAAGDVGARLWQAARLGNATLVAALLKNDPEVDFKEGYYGNTPLMAAAEEGHVEVMKMLLARNANVNAINRDSETPLMFAVDGGNAAAVQLLLDHGARPNDDDTYGETALSRARNKVETDIVNRLEAAGAKK